MISNLRDIADFTPEKPHKNFSNLRGIGYAKKFLFGGGLFY
jgi:hypothetical protein